jgi:hypothetical protein
MVGSFIYGNKNRHKRKIMPFLENSMQDGNYFMMNRWAGKAMEPNDIGYELLIEKNRLTYIMGKWHRH